MKMKKLFNIKLKLKLYAITLIASLMLVTSCNDVLNEQVVDFYNADNFFNTVGQSNTAITAIYAGLQNNIGSQTFLSSFTTMSDEARGNSWANVNVFHTFQFDSFNSTVASIYKNLYSGVGNCNFVISGLKKEVMGNQYEAYLAEAKFVRAYYYLNLVRIFGPVVISKSLPNDPFVTEGPRDSVYKVIDFILEDLTYASAYLPKTSIYGHPDKWTAMAMKARVHLWLASCVDNKVVYYENPPVGGNDYTPATHYALVKQLCQTVKDSSGYALYSDYEKLWLTDSKQAESGTGKKEHMFAINFNYTGNPNEGNPWTGMCMIWNNLKPAWKVTSDGAKILLGTGYSSLIPQPKFWLKYEGASTTTSTNYKTQAVGSRGDTRRFKGYTIEAIVSDINGQVIVAGTSAAIFDTSQSSMFIFSKYAGQGTSGTSTAGDAQIPVMRYADVLLMLAEASNWLDDMNTAKVNLNLVRSRAYEGASGAFPRLGYLEVDSKAGLADAIMEERCKELVAEVSRWFDLVRTKSIKKLEGYPTIPGTNNYYVVPTLTDKNYFFPIPANALLSNPKIEQSDLWK